jgi:hypothetical protein
MLTLILDSKQLLAFNPFCRKVNPWPSSKLKTISLIVIIKLNIMLNTKFKKIRLLEKKQNL